MDFEAIVIGSGCGGCAAAAALAGAGKRVLIIEQMERVGGRCSTSEKDGFKVDIGSHVSFRAEYGPFMEALKRVGMESAVEFQHVRKLLFKYNDFKINFDFDKVMRVFTDLVPAEMIKMAGGMLPMMSGMLDGIAESNEGISARDFLDRYTDNPTIHSILCEFLFIVTWIPYWETSQGECMRIFLDAMGPLLQGMGDGVFCAGYPKGGLISYPEALCAGIKQKGGDVLTNTKIAGVVIEGGKVSGVETAKGDLIKTGAVISNAGIKETVLDLVGTRHFESGYVASVTNLKPTASVYCLRLALDSQVTDLDGLLSSGCDNVVEYNRIMWNEKKIPDMPAPVMATSPSNMDPSLVPEGKQLVIVIGGCPYEPEENWEGWEVKALEAIEDAIPGIKDHILWKDFLTPGIYSALGEKGAPLIGIAQSPNQVGKTRSSSISPIPGLYFAGAETGTGVSGIGMELATSSGLACGDYILKM